MVLNRKRGTRKLFSCMYHGWVFGRTANSPACRCALTSLRKRCRSRSPAWFSFAAGRELSAASWFASFNEKVEPLADYLGEARRGIDELVDRSPVGKMEFSAGCHRYHFKGNWKLQLENQA